MEGKNLALWKEHGNPKQGQGSDDQFAYLPHGSGLATSRSSSREAGRK